ncbi:MAG: polysaccharide biosynthesis/export family protein [Armatimonadota bacterium]
MKIIFTMLIMLCLYPLAVNAADEYVIRAGDTLDIIVTGEPDLTKKTIVRPDGKVALGLIGDIKAEGLTPEQFRIKAITALKKYIKHPEMTVEVTGYDTAASINVLGAVRQPGHYPLRGKTTVTDALGLAGGTTEKAKIGEIAVIHKTAVGSQKTQVDLAKMVNTGNTENNLVLQPGDTVYVPQKKQKTDWLKILGVAVSVGYLLSK